MELPKGNTVLTRDSRPITIVVWPDEQESMWKVGQGGCTRIEAYDENGSMAAVPWIAVFKGDEIVARFSAGQVTVGYQRD